MRIVPDNVPLPGDAEPRTWRYKKRKRLHFWMDGLFANWWRTSEWAGRWPGDLYVRVEDKVNTVFCLVLGHVPIPAYESLNPKWDHCAYCEASTPGRSKR